MTEASSVMQSITFAAWRDGAPCSSGAARRHYVTLAELLVRLGSFGLGLTWKARIDDTQHTVFAEMERASVGSGIGTLELLALAAPHLQAVDAVFWGYADRDLVVILREVDSTSWDVCTANEWVLCEIRRHYPDASPTPSRAWDT